MLHRQEDMVIDESGGTTEIKRAMLFKASVALRAPTFVSKGIARLVERRACLPGFCSFLNNLEVRPSRVARLGLGCSHTPVKDALLAVCFKWEKICLFKLRLGCRLLSEATTSTRTE